MALRSPTGAAIDGVSVQNDDSVCSGLFFARLRPRGVRRAGVRVLAVDFRARVRPRAIRFFPLWVFRLAAVLFAIFFTERRFAVRFLAVRAGVRRAPRVCLRAPAFLFAIVPH